jgi:hypothetical protein
MDRICKQLKDYKKIMYKKNTGEPFHIHKYNDCPPSVIQTFHELTQSAEYTWDSNRVTFYYHDEDCDALIHYIAQLLSVIQPKNTPLIAYILLTSAKKYYPEDRVFGPDHVNTGYANNNHVVVYRKEEWFKVFIHECFHKFNKDRALFDSSLPGSILQLFKVESEVNLYESWCEIWARTLNCCMASVVHHIPFDMLLQREKKYSVRHMVNVLHHMGLTYEELLVEGNTFKEKTNVLAYVVIGAILMHHDFLSQFIQDKPIDEMFDLVDAKAYLDFIYDHFKSKSLLNLINHTEQHPQVTTTMSIVSF